MNRPMRPAPGGARDGGIHTAKAALVIVVVVVIGLLVLSKATTSAGKGGASAAGSSHHTTGKTTTTLSSAPTVPASTTTTVADSAVKLQVLNGANANLPLGSEWTNKLRSAYGYATQPPDNATANVASSVIYVITPGYEGNAEELARQVGKTSAIVQAVTAGAPIPAAERAKANLVLVIGPDLEATA